MGLYRRALTVLHKTLDLLTGLRKVRENIPQKETVADVIKVRCLRTLQDFGVFPDINISQERRELVRITNS